jgi:hypothetical protein
MTRKEKSDLRQSLSELGITCIRFGMIARFKTRQLYRESGNVHWMFAEKYGFVILDQAGLEFYNKLRKRKQMRKLRIRDVDRMCVYRYPRKAYACILADKRKKKAIDGKKVNK